MKKLNLLLGLVLSFAVVAMFTACNSGTETTDSSKETEVTDESETTEPADDKSSRPSPPAKAEGTIGEASVLVNYSQPGVKGRAVWGNLVPYGKIWRTGANEATTIEFGKDVKVNGTAVPAGKYALFTIPGEKEWKFVFNTEHDQWGAYDYDESKNVASVPATPAENEMTERLTFAVTDSGVDFMWDKVKVGFTVE